MIKITSTSRCEVLALYMEHGSVKMWYKNSNTGGSRCYFCAFEMLGVKSSSNGLIAVRITANKKYHVEMLSVRGGFSPSISHQQDSHLRTH